jgi:hypothetical protein
LGFRWGQHEQARAAVFKQLTKVFGSDSTRDFPDKGKNLASIFSQLAKSGLKRVDVPAAAEKALFRGISSLWSSFDERGISTIISA